MNTKSSRKEGCFVEFPEKGVEIVVPPQQQVDKVSVEEIITTNWDEIKEEKSDFIAKREALNFQVVDSSNTQLTDFDPPIELKVNFTFDDLKESIENNKLISLAFWNGSRWVRFTEKKHNLSVHLTKINHWVGYFVVKISNWGDPSVSVGR